MTKEKKEVKKTEAGGFDYEGAYKQQQALIERLKTERDAFKLTAERVSSDYLNTCAKCKLLESDLDAYHRYWPEMRRIAKAWKKIALAGKEKEVTLLDTVRTAYMHIYWYRSQLSRLKRWRLRDKMWEMEKELDDMLVKVEGLDRE